MVFNISIYLHFDGLFIKQHRDLSLRISINSTNDNTVNRFFPYSFLSVLHSYLSSDNTSQAIFCHQRKQCDSSFYPPEQYGADSWLVSLIPFVYSRNMLLSNIFRLRFCLLSPLDIISCLSFCLYFAFSFRWIRFSFSL